MRTMPWNVLIIVALLLSACGQDASTSTTASSEGGGLESCLNGVQTGLDCYAKAEVRRLANSQQMTGATGDKTELQIGSVALGQTTDAEFRITNTANLTSAAALRIDDIKFSYTPTNPQETSVVALSCWDSTGTVPCSEKKGMWKKLAPVGGATPSGLFAQETFKIRYTQFDTKVRTAKVCMVMGGDKDFAKKNLCFQVVTTAGKPKISVQPPQVDFPYVKLGSEATGTFAVLNGGESTLYLSKFELNLDSSFAVDIAGKSLKGGTALPAFDPPLAIAPGSTLGGVVHFKPVDDKKRAGEIKIFSNDLTIVGGLPILVTANTKVPCIQVTPSPVVNFGAVKVGSTVPQNITVANCGSEKLTLSNIGLNAGARDAYTVDFGTLGKPTAAAPWVLAVNDSKEFKVTYMPPALADAPDLGSLDFESNASPVALKLTGVCVAETCPVALVTVQEGEQVVPQTVLHLKGSASYAPGGGSVSKYVWTVAKQPEGYKQTFVPGANFPDPTFTTNAAGTYEFCLDVYDNQSPPKKSCGDPVCVEVLVIPSEALHAELLWKTPADSDETNQGQGVGADMDLHLAHPLAQGQDLDCDGEPDPWFNQPFDCFWFNPMPKWGSASTTDDDAHLDLDDTDGAGPENINLDVPQGTVSEPLQYSVGVHYWNDHGFGKSYATVRIYVLGNLKVEYKDQEMSPVDMWYVGKINWPNDAIGGTDAVFKPCLQTGNQCLALKDPKDPKGGKMWSDTGTACIRPCYLSPLGSADAAMCSTK